MTVKALNFNPVKGCIILFAVQLLAQVPTTTIVGPVYDAFGNLYSGNFTVQSQVKTTTGYAITGTSRIVYVNNGVISPFALTPNDQSTPNLTSYLITFANQDKWICIIPTSTIPVAYTSVCSPNATPPNQAQAISPSQIIPSNQNGQAILTLNGITVWGTINPLPTPPSSGTYCLVSVNGALVWSSCGQPTTVSWSTLTSSQWSTLTPSQWSALTP